MDDPWLRERGSSPISLTWRQAPPLTDPDTQLVSAVRDVFAVSAVRRIKPGDGQRLGGFFTRPTEALELRGRFLIPSGEAYDLVAPRFRALGHLALFRQAGEEQLIYAVPGELPSDKTRVWLAAVLFAATVLSVLYVGATMESGDLTSFNLLSGVPYAASLLGILIAHEGGHYVMARRKGVPSSLPFLIPMPVTSIGTMGAVMQMKAPPKNRSALLAVGAAGPIAGLVVAIPVLILGLMLSPVQATPHGAYIQEGNSILYAVLKYLVKGEWLPGNGLDVMLNPVGWAGWVGLLITSVNLIPAGQLDGGHMAFVLLGRRARYLTLPIVIGLIALGVLTQWWGWLLWAGMVYLFGQVHATPLDDVTPLKPGEKAVAILLLVVFVLIFMPVPLMIYG